MNIENTLYHGSKNNFNEFEIPKYHTNGGTLGYGIYLTDSIERAKSYANDSGYLYTVELNDELTNSKPLSAKEVTLTVNQVAQIIEKVAQKQIDEEEYPYILSDWEEPTSETTMDAGNKAIVKRIAQNIVDDTDDLNIINGISNQLGGNDSGAQMLNPVLKEMNIHYAVLDVDYYDKSKEYVVFNPEDIKVSNKQEIRLLNEQNKSNALTFDKNSQSFSGIVHGNEISLSENEYFSDLTNIYDIKSLSNNELKAITVNLLTQAKETYQEMSKLSGDDNDLYFWADDYKNEKTNYNALQNELSQRNINIPENLKYADEPEKMDKAKQKLVETMSQPTLSQQYKKLLNQLKEPDNNNKQTEKQLKQVRQDISQQTQKELKDFAKANPDLKKPRAKKDQQTLQQ
ncbi:hypothetical protein [Leuconostoc carnosum]|uniref:ADP-ribosyltransferase-containing protein n=1 Tax=Leuconostoc carnosum TaxID=1252 RepID=UPI000D504CBC|nr:hypothetical protein [Leuconostoc carnosum]SPJ44560.1 conserved protein of unknown function [Leuconostoc carnosum]